MSVSPFPFGVRPQKEDASGNPRNGATWTFYDAGTTDLATTWTSSTGATANDNPLSCNSLGQPESSGGTAVDIYGLDGHSYDVVFKDSAGTTIDTYTSIYTVATGNTGVWINPLTATRTGANTFTLVGDQTAIFTVGRKVKLTGNGDRYGYISVSAYTTLTTITLRNIVDGSAIPVYSTIPSGTDTAYVGIDPAHLSSQPSQIMEVYEEWSIAVASTVTEDIVIKGGGHLNITAATTLSGDILIEPGGQLTMSTAASLATGRIVNNGTITISFATTIAADIVNNGDISVGAATTFSGNVYCGTGVFSGSVLPTFTGDSFDAGLYQVFTNTATPVLPVDTFVRPEWWGAARDGVTDDYTALNTAIQNYTNVRLAIGTYLIGTAINVPNHTHLQGMGRNLSKILLSGDINGLSIHRNTVLKDLRIIGNASQTAGKYCIGLGIVGETDSARSYFENVIIGGHTTFLGDSSNILITAYAIRGGVSFLNNFVNCYIVKADVGYYNIVDTTNENNAMNWSGCEFHACRVGVNMGVMNNIGFYACTIENCDEHAMIVGNCSAATFDCLHIEANHVAATAVLAAADILINSSVAAVGSTDPAAGLTISNSRISAGTNSAYGIYVDRQRNTKLDNVYFKGYGSATNYLYVSSDSLSTGYWVGYAPNGTKSINNQGFTVRDRQGNYGHSGTTATLTATGGVEQILANGVGETYLITVHQNAPSSARYWHGVVQMHNSGAITITRTHGITAEVDVIDDGSGNVQIQNNSASARGYLWSAIKLY